MVGAKVVGQVGELAGAGFPAKKLSKSCPKHSSPCEPVPDSCVNSVYRRRSVRSKFT